MHGLRGYPKHTWEDSRDVGSKVAGATTLSKRKTFKSYFKTTSSTFSENRCTKMFWHDKYLTQDIPEARIWTYGYNADVIGGTVPGEQPEERVAAWPRPCGTL